MPTAKSAATPTRPATIFSRPRLALAASLLLTLLAGVWLMTRQGEPPKDQLAEGAQSSPAARSEKPGNALVPNAVTERNDSRGNEEHSESGEDKAAAFVAASNARPRRSSRQTVAKRRKLTPRVEERAPAPLEEVAIGNATRWQVEQPMTPQQREATEQLMFALRLASAKLNYAQREMQEIGRAGK